MHFPACILAQARVCLTPPASHLPVPTSVHQSKVFRVLPPSCLLCDELSSFQNTIFPLISLPQSMNSTLRHSQMSLSPEFILKSFLWTKEIEINWNGRTYILSQRTQVIYKIHFLTQLKSRHRQRYLTTWQVCVSLQQLERNPLFNEFFLFLLIFTLATWCKELTHLKRPWCWERLRAGGEGDDRGWDGWMASPTQWTWVWIDSGSWWWTGRPGVLQFMGSQRIGHDWVTELNCVPGFVHIFCKLRVIDFSQIPLMYTLLFSPLHRLKKPRLACVHAKLLQSYLILYNPMDCTLPGSSVYSILQARILEWVAMPSSRGSFWPRDQTCVS